MILVYRALVYIYWKPLVEQTFREYERGDFAICVPAMLCVLEGSITATWSVPFQNQKNRRRFFSRKIAAERKGSVIYYLWKSVAAFIDTIFETGVSDSHVHPVLKRNLILHGKSDPAKWDQADCLRLFQAIDSLLSLYRFRKSRSVLRS